MSSATTGDACIDIFETLGVFGVGRGAKGVLEAFEVFGEEVWGVGVELVDGPVVVAAGSEKGVFFEVGELLGDLGLGEL